MADQFAHDTAREDLLILVDGLDRPTGTASKEQAHSEGLLHRAFSVVLFREDAQGTELLLAQRAAGKYHSAELWANSCCSHPRVGENTVDAAYRRVAEELGCEAQGLQEIGAFAYRATFPNGLAEFEYDHVLIGQCAGEPTPDPREVGAVRWVSIEELAHELAQHPERVAAWAFMVLSMAMEELQKRERSCWTSSQTMQAMG